MVVTPSSLIEYHRDLITMTKWTPRPLTERERILAQFLTRWPSADEKLKGRFHEFVSMNKLDSETFAHQIAYASAQWRSDGLKGTTMVSYGFRLLRMTRLSSAEYHETKRILRNMEYSVRHDAVTRAPELTSGDYERLLSSLDIYSRVCVELIYTTALRLGDLNDICASEVFLAKPDGVTIQLCGGKNHRRFCDRDLIVTRVSPTCFAYLQQVKLCAATAGHEVRIVNMRTCDLADAISAALNRKATSYSIRNLRILELIEAERDANGVVDWSTVAGQTHHRSIAALRSAYQMPSSRVQQDR